MVREEADERTVLRYAQAFFQRARNTPRPIILRARQREAADDTDEISTELLEAVAVCGKHDLD